MSPFPQILMPTNNIHKETHNLVVTLQVVLGSAELTETQDIQDYHVCLSCLFTLYLCILLHQAYSLPRHLLLPFPDSIYFHLSPTWITNMIYMFKPFQPPYLTNNRNMQSVQFCNLSWCKWKQWQHDGQPPVCWLQHHQQFPASSCITVSDDFPTLYFVSQSSSAHSALSVAQHSKYITISLFNAAVPFDIDK